MEEKMKEYEAKGDLTFILMMDDDSCGYSYSITTIEDIVNRVTKYNKDEEFIQHVTDSVKKDYCSEVADLMSGNEFLENVRDGSITNYDGFIGEVYVDGFKSNLGLVSDNGFMGGKFMVNEYAFEEICKDHKVEVDWANK